jgi:DNA repair protein RadC
MDLKSLPSPEKKAPKPHHLGHRQRLKQRFDKGGLMAVSDYELVELILFLVIPRADVKPLAKTLLQEFGSIHALLSSDKERLLKIPGIGQSVAHVFRLFHQTMLKAMQQQIYKKPVLASWQQVLDYCAVDMANKVREELRLLFLDNKHQLVGDEIHQTGTIDQTPMFPREVVKRALDLGASAIIMVHNHPSGDPTPSTADINMTLKVIDAGKHMGILVHDHLIIGKGRHVSFKSLGII